MSTIFIVIPIKKDTLFAVFFICFLPHHCFMLWFHLYSKAEDEYNEWWHALKIIGFCLRLVNFSF